MTINSETIRNDYTGNGVNDTFPFEFIIYDSDDIDVYVDGVLQTVDIHFTIADEDIENSSGGSVVFGIDYIPADGSAVALISSAPYKQETALASRDSTYEITYDKAVILINQLREMIRRCPILPNYSPYSDMILPEPLAGYYIRWRTDLLGFENAEGSEGGGGGGVGGGSWVDKTIASGVVTVSSGEGHLFLSGEGDVADSLTTIVGGTAGDIITLWRDPDADYTITITPGSGIYTQAGAVCLLNNNNDNITLISKGSNIWAEWGGRINAG